MMKRFLLAAAALTALAGPAVAADAVTMDTPVPTQAPQAPMFTWTGPYIGVFGGYGLGRSSAANDPGTGNGDAFDEGNAAVTLGLTPRGILGGVTLGYNHQSGAFVVGAEVTGGYLGLTDAFSLFVADGPNGTLDDDQGTVGYGWYATLAGRVGVALDRTLLFATAGGIITQYGAVYGDLDGGVPDPTDATTLGGPQLGYLVGGGAEFAFDANWTAKLEYNYFNLGTDATTNTDGDTFIHRNSAHLIRFGLNYLVPN
jgi:outer membrane immunogenic protein